MRTSTAAACCALAVLLAALPGISAASDTLEVASGSGRQLLVVNDNVTSTAAVTADPGSTSSQPISSSSASSVGADVNPADLVAKDAEGDAAAPTDSKEEAAARAAKQQARKQRAQQQRALGRKGGPQLRQAGGGGGGGGGAGGPPEVFIGDLDDYVLPFCQPSEGVVCVDRDRYSLLKSQPAIISLENAYPYTQVKPAVSYAGSSVTTLDFLADTYGNRNQGVTKAALETLAGTEAVNADTTVTTTALQGTVDASRVDRPIPDAVSVVADRTAALGTYEWKTWRPRFTYQVGANYGLPVGLAVVTDTSGK